MISWEAVLSAAIGVILFLWKGVPFFTWISNSLGEWRKHRLEKSTQHLSNTAEIRRIEADERSTTFEEMRQIIEQKDRDIEKLEKKFAELEQNHSLPRPLMTMIYKALRKLGTQIENIKFLYGSGAAKEVIEAELEILEQKFFDVDKLLP